MTVTRTAVENKQLIADTAEMIAHFEHSPTIASSNGGFEANPKFEEVELGAIRALRLALEHGMDPRVLRQMHDKLAGHYDGEQYHG